MYSNTIQARIEATLKELYKVHDTVFKPAVMYAMYSNIRAYFIILDKNGKELEALMTSIRSSISSFVKNTGNPVCISVAPA